MASQKHRQLLIKELNKIDLSLDTTLEEMIALITTSKGTITFNREDHSLGDVTYNNALYLTMTHLHKYVPLSLVDSWFAMNVCPWRTIKRLGIKESSFLTDIIEYMIL